MLFYEQQKDTTYFSLVCLFVENRTNFKADKITFSAEMTQLNFVEGAETELLKLKQGEEQNKSRNNQNTNLNWQNAKENKQSNS